MRRRLYETSQEDSELFSKAHSASKEKSMKRFYADNSSEASPAALPDTAALIAPFAEMIVSAAKHVDAFYGLYNTCQKNCMVLPLTLYGSWCDSASITSQIVETSLQPYRDTWEKGLSTVCKQFGRKV